MGGLKRMGWRLDSQITVPGLAFWTCEDGLCLKKDKWVILRTISKPTVYIDVWYRFIFIYTYYCLRLPTLFESGYHLGIFHTRRFSVWKRFLNTFVVVPIRTGYQTISDFHSKNHGNQFGKWLWLPVAVVTSINFSILASNLLASNLKASNIWGYPRVVTEYMCLGRMHGVG